MEKKAEEGRKYERNEGNNLKSKARKEKEK